MPLVLISSCFSLCPCAWKCYSDREGFNCKFWGRFQWPVEQHRHSHGVAVLQPREMHLLQSSWAAGCGCGHLCMLKVTAHFGKVLGSGFQDWGIVDAEGHSMLWEGAGFWISEQCWLCWALSCSLGVTQPHCPGESGHNPLCPGCLCHMGTQLHNLGWAKVNFLRALGLHAQQWSCCLEQLYLSSYLVD